MGSMFSLEGKTAIVTGASRWTGKVVALEMAKAGADLVICARKAERLEAAAEEIRRLGRKCIAVPTDVENWEQVQALVRNAREALGRIDILVNNAGTSFIIPTLELSEDRWDALVRLNLKAHFLCSKAVAPIMIEQGGGSIVDVASTEGLRASPTCVAYGAAKAGLMNLVMSLAVEWGKHRIRVNAVAPGFIATPIHPGYLEQVPHLKAIYERVPLGRGVKMEEVAAAVIYLASDAAGCTTGVTIPVDGGMVATIG
jgi:NAD(P)-dependent dehydrogenase (short-subunit alcohol dehydrogenase family)